MSDTIAAPVPAVPDPAPEATAGAPEAVTFPPLTPEETDRLTDDLIEAMKTVHDPEIPVDIYELGLIYKVDIDDDRHVTIDMTLTAPACPAAEVLPREIEVACAKVAGVRSAKAMVTFDPPWTPARMSDEAKLALNML